jgi:hypothetical protein
MLRVEVMRVSLKTDKRRSHCPVFSFRPRLRRAEGLPGMTTEDLDGYERRSAPPALLPLICMVIPDYSSFSVLRETPMTFACGHFIKLKCYDDSRLLPQRQSHNVLFTPRVRPLVRTSGLCASIPRPETPFPGPRPVRFLLPG